MMSKAALALAKRRGGAMMTTIHCALRLLEEERRQQCRHPKGGKYNKDSIRQRTPFRVEGCVAPTMDNRLTTEEDEVVTTPPGLLCDRPPDTQQSAIPKGGGGGSKEDNKEEDSDSFWRMTSKVETAPAKRRRVKWWQLCVVLCIWQRRNIVMLASLPLLQWRHCRHCTGLFAIVAKVPLSLLRRHLCNCCAGVFAWWQFFYY